MTDPIDQQQPFWKRKRLEEMSRTEWESLCDGCGRCCLHKLQDEDTDELYYTNVACRLLDLDSCRCRHYADRHTLVDDCVALDPSSLSRLEWLPSTCAYRLLYEGQDLPSWHPLITGTAESVHLAGISVRRMAVAEQSVTDLEDHIIDEAP